jgi:hypothetical protein
MKRLIPLFLITVFLAGCATRGELRQKELDALLNQRYAFQDEAATNVSPRAFYLCDKPSCRAFSKICVSQANNKV